MVYIKFVHPDLEADPVYQAWLAKAQAGKVPNWKELADWLGQHTGIGYSQDDVLSLSDYKCWYSEMNLAGNHSKDVDHFRPKNRANGLTENQQKSIEGKIGYPLPEKRDQTGGYPWLVHNPLNYRLSHPHCNRPGNKGSVFPILSSTSRLLERMLPSQAKEHHFLLDPTVEEDPALLMVKPDGEIVPVFPEGSFPSGIMRVRKASEVYKNLRAWVSIIVYGLDQIAFVKARQKVYLETREIIVSIEEAIRSPNPDLLNREAQLLFRKLSMASPFSLAARCAVQDYLATADQADRIKEASTRLISAIWDRIYQLEH